VKRIYISDEAYKLLVEYAVNQRGSVKGISAVASQLIIEAISQKTSGLIDQKASSPIDQKPISPTSPESQKATQSTPIDQSQPKRGPRPATQAQINAIMEIAWEIATWEEVSEIVSKKLGFDARDLSQVTSQQASQIIQTLKELKKPLTNEQVKEVKALLENLAQKQNLKPEDLAAKLNIPSSTSQLRLYHLELLKQLAAEGETK
jgi:hypothetical protein